MNITPGEAANALADIEGAERRTLTRRGYRIAGPILILWGVIWVAGYGAMGVVSGAAWGWMWLGLDLVGGVGTAVLALRGRTAFPGARTHVALSFLYALAIVAMVAATYAVLQPTRPEAFMTYPAIMVGFAYVLFGLMRMPRMALVGATVFVLSLIGFYFVESCLTYWLAGVVGGGLIMGGVWLRSA